MVVANLVHLTWSLSLRVQWGARSGLGCEGLECKTYILANLVHLTWLLSPRVRWGAWSGLGCEGLAVLDG
jgi:hypothetical protein